MKITAGLPFNRTFSFADYTEAEGYSLSGKIHDGSTETELASSLFTADGDQWDLAIPAATTTGYTAGSATLYIIATKSGVETLVSQAPVVIEALGTLSHNQTMVTALRSVMEGRTEKEYESLTTPSGESITRLDPEKIQKWLQYYEKRLANETARASSGSRVRNIQMRIR